MAGLLARGSPPCTAFPASASGFLGARLAAYSCGGSHGVGPEARTVFPFNPQRGTIAITICAEITPVNFGSRRVKNSRGGRRFRLQMGELGHDLPGEELHRLEPGLGILGVVEAEQQQRAEAAER